MWRWLLLGLWCCVGAAQATPKPEAPPRSASAVFAGGCFWCMERPFDDLPGVLATEAGYIGGQLENPTYEQVTTGATGHYEAVRVLYDPTRIDYSTLLQTFWRNVDPVDAGGQFCDRGEQYRSAIFVGNTGHRRAAQASLAAVQAALDAPVATQILPAAEFYRAEDHHQNYYRKHPLRYRYYRWSCKRDARLEKLWGDSAGR